MQQPSQKFFAAPGSPTINSGVVLRRRVDLGAQLLECTADPNERLHGNPHHFYPVMIAGLPEMIKGAID